VSLRGLGHFTGGGDGRERGLEMVVLRGKVADLIELHNIVNRERVDSEI
jgi:hypothetical protein